MVTVLLASHSFPGAAPLSLRYLVSLRHDKAMANQESEIGLRY